MEANVTNFWDLQYIWYILGFLFMPRFSFLFIFNNYVTNGFAWQNLLVGLTIWWKYEVLALGWFTKLCFTTLIVVFPRLLLGITGYIYLPSENHTAMIVFCVLGLAIDTAIKFRKTIIKKLFPGPLEETEIETTGANQQEVRPQTKVHAVGFLYLMCASVDGKFDMEKRIVISEKLTGWVTDSSQNASNEDVKEAVKDTVHDTIDWYTEEKLDRVEIFKFNAMVLAKDPSFGLLSRRKVLREMMEIARTDKDHSANAEELIKLLSTVWETPLPV